MDPFKSVLQDAETQLGSAQLLLRQYRSSLDSAKLADLHNTIQDLTEVIRELSGSIAAVQARPEQYGLSQYEIESRIEQVGHINRQVADIQEELSKIRSETRASRGAARLQDSASSSGFDGSLSGTAGVSGGTDEVSAEDRQLLFQSTIQEQDSILNEVEATVANLREQANVMSAELGDQADLIDDFEAHVDSSNDRLRQGMKRVDWVLRNNRDTLSSCCIWLLMFVLILLLVLIVVT